MIRRILLGIGGTPFTDVAIRRAVELGRLHDAQITAVTVVDERRLGRVGPVPIGAGAAAVELRKHRVQVTRHKVEEAITKLKGVCEEHDVRLTIQREKGDPFGLMVDYARYHDLSIFGMRSMFEYDVMGASDVKPADMLAQMVLGGVRPIIAVSDQYRPIRRVLIAFGGSIRAAESMKQFIRMRLWPNVSLRVFNCEGNEDESRRLLTDAAVYCRQHGYEPEVYYRPGVPREEILTEAERWDADMIVLGTSRHGALSRSIFGSTAMEVIRRAERPLFLGQ